MRDTLTLSEGIAQFVCDYPDAQIPSGVIDDAVLRVLDTLGIALRAYEIEGAQIPVDFAAQSGGVAESTIVGTAQRTSAVGAAFVNGALAHWPDFDDTDSDSMFHPSSVVVPTALALTEKTGASGSACLSAIVVGAEVGLRVARLGRHQFQQHGYHATGVCGPFAAAAVAARLLGLDRSAAASALGIAGCLSAGLLQGHSDGSWAKRFYSGWAAHTGVTAAMLAAAGAVGSAEIFEGTAGFYRVLLGDFADSIAWQQLTGGLGEEWALPQVTFKPYPSAAWTHSSIDALLGIMQSERITYESIEAIECRVPTAAVPLVCEPRDAKIQPKTTYHMKFSLPFTVAIAAVLGQVDVSDFSEDTLNDARILELAQRTACAGDPALPARGFPAIVRVIARNGKSYTKAVSAQRGGPGNPMSRQDLLAKFARNTERALGAQRSHDLSRAILQLAGTGDVGGMMISTQRVEG